MKIKQRALTILLAMAMMLSFMPSMAFATEDQGEETLSPETEVTVEQSEEATGADTEIETKGIGNPQWSFAGEYPKYLKVGIETINLQAEITGLTEGISITSVKWFKHITQQHMDPRDEELYGTSFNDNVAVCPVNEPGSYFCVATDNEGNSQRCDYYVTAEGSGDPVTIEQRIISQGVFTDKGVCVKDISVDKKSVNIGDKLNFEFTICTDNNGATLSGYSNSLIEGKKGNSGYGGRYFEPTSEFKGQDSVTVEYFGDYGLYCIEAILTDGTSVSFKDCSTMTAAEKKGLAEENTYYVDMSTARATVNNDPNDDVAPVITGLTVSSSSIKLGDDLKVSVKATDNDTINSIMVHFENGGTSAASASMMTYDSDKEEWVAGYVYIPSYGNYKVQYIEAIDRSGNKGFLYNTKSNFYHEEQPCADLSAANFSVTVDGEPDEDAPVVDLTSLSVALNYAKLINSNEGTLPSTELKDGNNRIRVKITDKTGVATAFAVYKAGKGGSGQPLTAYLTYNQSSGYYEGYINNIFYGRYELLNIYTTDVFGNYKEYSKAIEPGLDLSAGNYYVGIEEDVKDNGIATDTTVFTSGNGMTDNATLSASTLSDTEDKTTYDKMHNDESGAVENRGFYQIGMTNYADYNEGETEQNVKVRLEAKGTADGNVVTIKHLKNDETIETRNCVVKNGYVSIDITEFSPFLLEVDTSNSHNINYEIEYRNMEGADNGDNPTLFCKDTPEIVFEPATKTGFSFEGWYKDADLTERVTSFDPSKIEGDPQKLVLYAKWESYNGFEFRKLTTEDAVVIIGYTGDSTDIVLPERMGGYPVVGFSLEDEYEESEACRNIKTIRLNNNITNCNYSHFNNLPALEQIIVNEDNVGLSSVDGVLYDKAEKVLYSYPCGKKGQRYTVPEGVETIDTYAVRWNPELTAITLPSSLKTVEWLGIDCEYLKEVTILSPDVDLENSWLGVIVDDEDEENPTYTPIEGFSIIGKRGSSAEAYASEYGIRFVELDEDGKSEGGGSSNTNTVINTVPQIQEVYAPDLPKITAKASSAIKKGMKFKWKKLNKKNRNKVTAIEVQYSPSKDFSNAATVIAGKGKASIKIKNLSKKTKYWARARVIREADGVKYVGKWSKTKKVKTK